jgi:hypothetical protein
MGIVLYRVHGDLSPYRLDRPDRGTPIRLAWLPGLRSITRQLLSVVDGVRR